MAYPNIKTHKSAPGDSAWLHEEQVWRLVVTKRAAAGPDGPGRPLELTGTAVLTQTAFGFTGNCKDGGKLVSHFRWTLRRK